MRCSSCNKFCSAEAGEPSVDDITIDCAIAFGPQATPETVAAAWKPGDSSFLTVKAEVSIEKTSACCGDEVASATAEITEEIEDEAVLQAVLAHLAKPLKDEEHDLEIEEDGVTYVESGAGKRDDPYVERVDVAWHVTCCGEPLGSGTVSGKIEEWEV